jgi:hypothetical protein
MVVDCSEIKLTVFVSTDTEEDAAALLREVAKRVKNGETAGDGSYCAGTYEFEIGDERDTLTARVAALVAALRPFAQIGEDYLSSEDDGERLWIEGAWWSSDGLTVGHFRNARAALDSATAKGEGE